MPRTHDRTHFYKFATFNTACKILDTCRLRWSSPLLFNDPFDHQIEFSFDFNQQEFTNAFIDEMEKIIFGPKDIQIDGRTYFGNKLKLLRENRKSFSWNEKQNWTEIRKVLQMEIENIKANDEFANDINDQIKSELELTRVLCVTENYTNVVMWSHYAEGHKGVVFKLNCIEELDNNLLVAAKLIIVKSYLLCYYKLG